MTETLFSQDNTEDNIKSYRDLLVGDGKKFRDDEEVAKGKYFADAAIAVKDKQLDEQRELILKQREQINTQESLETLLDQLKQQELANSKVTPAKEVSDTKPINTKEIESLVSSKILQHEVRKREQANLDLVNTKLREQYGDKTAALLQSKIDELGLSKDDIDVLAKKSPTAFFNTLGLNQMQTESFQAPPRSSVRNDNFGPKVEKRTWSWYKQKYKNRDFIANKDINTQMAKDAADLGDAFYDGDFYNNYHRQG